MDPNGDSNTSCSGDPACLRWQVFEAKGRERSDAHFDDLRQLLRALHPPGASAYGRGGATHVRRREHGGAGRPAATLQLPHRGLNALQLLLRVRLVAAAAERAEAAGFAELAGAPPHLHEAWDAIPVTVALGAQAGATPRKCRRRRHHLRVDLRRDSVAKAQARVAASSQHRRCLFALFGLAAAEKGCQPRRRTRRWRSHDRRRLGKVDEGVPLLQRHASRKQRQRWGHRSHDPH
mmetsp:Transcript_51928/g.149723  ORF Transcript_51928/g.149723 Transcript_51928/m.149723 type:complete len:235 (+) Transcript_51928:327-1031(+)